MKKTITFILTLVLCLSLCACSNSDEELEKYKKYETLINYLEAEEYENAYSELMRIGMGGESENNTTEANKEEQELVTVEITLDNWEEYFEIRPYEESQYNDFGDLTYKCSGYAIYLKDVYLSRLMENGADVTFKVGVTIEYKEYDRENFALVDGGSIYSTEQDEITPKVHDGRNSVDTDTLVSSANGQVCASMVCGTGKGVGLTEWWGFYTGDFEIRDVTGTLILSE